MANKKLALLPLAVVLPLLMPNKGMVATKAKSLSDSAENFVYSATFKQGEEAGFTFGKVGDSYYSVVANNQSLELVKNQKEKEPEVLKTSTSELSEDDNSLCLVVNEGIAKVFLNHNPAAALIYSLEDYAGGEYGILGTAYNREFFETDTLDGDLFIGGYTLNKVVNVTDGYSLLDASAYTINKGILTISDDYLKTLEVNTEYTFRAVTSLTDLSFVKETTFAGVSAVATRENVYRGDDISVVLSKDVTVNKVTFNGKVVDYTKDAKKITVSHDVLVGLENGDYTLKVFTNLGRPEVKITLTEANQTYPEIPVEVSHFFFWIDIGIFAGLIIAYVGYSAYKKYKEEGGKQ